MITNVPNLLTLSRILVIPALIGAFYLPSPAANWTALALFVAAGITDFLDGWLARRRGEMSNLGRFLDPVADKLLVAAAILMLVAFQRISGLSILAAVVILCREILVTGLREFLAELRVRVPVSKLAKWKTTVQIVAIAFLLVGNAGPAALPIEEIGIVGLWLAAIVTLYTGWDYLRTGLRHIVAESEAEPRPAQPPVASESPRRAPAPPGAVNPGRSLG
ncbi:MAG TPA: CDP-diacylglycerol--glycerol-3-phosphate 3-phosphatidyltransferase [Candidatus Cybelea sp.]|nr:CDP-diacylglycerol--glycerol-3-phosphate 3-phosphatidyltransferase [Candidatus Cybelea sp.]